MTQHRIDRVAGVATCVDVLTPKARPQPTPATERIWRAIIESVAKAGCCCFPTEYSVAFLRDQSDLR